ncbi:MAG: F0F1 ATP synthase subunit epsilon [Gammaproteobacteria bacterium]|nr:F0F1 ATP synthase subunit epsilon [Gammaproteobacteria bacterium]
MTQTMRLDIVSAEKEIFSGHVESVSVTGKAGELGIFPGHAPLLTGLKPGNIRAMLPNNKEEIFYVSSGMLEVQPFVVTVLADTAQRADDIDEAAAIIAKENAEKALANQNSQVDFAKATAELAEAIAQIQTIKKIRKHR